MSRFVTSVALLTLVYALVLGSLNPWDLALGAAVSAALVLFFRRVALGRHPMAFSVTPSRFVAFVPFLFVTLWDVTTGAFAVLSVVLRLRPLKQPGLVEIPLEARTPVGVVVAAFSVCVAPGTYLLDWDAKRRVMLVHALDASDPDALRAHYHHLYERYQSKVFP